MNVICENAEECPITICSHKEPHEFEKYCIGHCKNEKVLVFSNCISIDIDFITKEEMEL